MRRAAKYSSALCVVSQTQWAKVSITGQRRDGVTDIHSRRGRSHCRLLRGPASGRSGFILRRRRPIFRPTRTLCRPLTFSTNYYIWWWDALTRLHTSQRPITVHSPRDTSVARRAGRPSGGNRRAAGRTRGAARRVLHSAHRAHRPVGERRVMAQNRAQDRAEETPERLLETPRHTNTKIQAEGLET